MSNPGESLQVKRIGKNLNNIVEIIRMIMKLNVHLIDYQNLTVIVLFSPELKGQIPVRVFI